MNSTRNVSMLAVGTSVFLVSAACPLLAATSPRPLPVKPIPNPTLSQLAAGTWFVAAEMPSPGVQGSHAAAYSGFAFDTVRGRIIKRGGGHCDYKGTEVQEFDAMDQLSWSVASPSVPDTEFLSSAHFDNGNFPGAVVVLADGSAPANFANAVANGQAAPVARHTTNSTTFIESTGEFFMTGNYTYGEASQGNAGATGCTTGSTLPYTWGPRDTWAYNTQQNTWRYLSQHTIDMEWAGCVWAPQGAGVSDSQGAVFCITEQTRELFRYDVSADSWSTVNANVPTTGLGINLSYSRNYQSLYYYRDGGLWRYDISSDNWQSVNSSGSAGAGNMSATAYDSTNDVVGVWDGDNLFFCEFSSANDCSWSAASSENSPGGSSGGGVASNFAYDSTNNVFWAANAASGRVMFGAIRFKVGEPPGPAPMNPEDLIAN